MAVRLSPTESRILELLPIMETKQVAAQLRIEEGTVYQYLKRIRSKYRQARDFVNMMDGRYRTKPSLRRYLYVKEFTAKGGVVVIHEAAPVMDSQAVQESANQATAEAIGVPVRKVTAVRKSAPKKRTTKGRKHVAKSRARKGKKAKR